MRDVWLFGGIGVFVLIVNFIEYLSFLYCCIRITSKMKQHYLNAVLRQNAGWFDKNSSGLLSSKFNESMGRINEGIGNKLSALIRGMVMFVTGIIISFFYEWRLALMMLGIGPVCCVLMSILARVRNYGFTFHAIQDEMVERYSAELGKGRSNAVQRGIWCDAIGGIFLCILFTYYGGGIYYGGQLFSWKIIHNPGDVLIIVFAMSIGANFLGRLSPHLMDLLNAKVAAATIYEIIDRVPEIDAYSSSGDTVNNLVGQIVFENVHFRYPTRKRTKVLNGFNLTVEPGTSVAFVGHSGCGKTTLIKLLTRLYEQEDGRVMIDGHDVRDLNIDWLRRRIGVVQQEPNLFNDTIRNNVLVGNPNSASDDMIRVCKMANAHDFILKMPRGYETKIGDGGVRLSGGQKQRIAIARALIRDPSISLLDEATSALDAHSERIVQSALNNAAKGRTTTMIAHRISTIRDADKIVFIDNGAIMESGTHEELLALGGKYAGLVNAQRFEEVLEKDSDTSMPSRQLISQTSSEVGTSNANDPILTLDETENTEYAEEVQRVMEEDGVITSGYLDIFKNAQGNYANLVIGTFFAALRGMQTMVLAVLICDVYEAFKLPADETTHALFVIFLLYGCLGLFVFVTQTISATLFTITAENLALKFRVLSLRSLLHQDAAFFDNPAHAPGKLITRLASDAPNVKAVVNGKMLQVIHAIAAIAVNLITGYIYCWQIAAVGTVIIVLFGLITLIIAYRMASENLKQVKEDEAGNIAVEIIESVRTIQLLTSSQPSIPKQLQKCVIGRLHAITETFMYLANFVCYGLGASLMYHNIVDPNLAFRAINSMTMGVVSVIYSSQHFPEFVKAKTAAGMLFKLIYREPKTGDLMEGSRAEIKGCVSFDAVKFSYPQKPMHPVLTDLQFTARNGQTVALVGPSGAGKSTCIGLLERFYDMSGGVVKIDGQAINTFSLHHLRTQMTLVSQEPLLFSGTIKDNICFGLKNVPCAKIQEALELANASNFISNLPHGIDTEVGEKGTQLSGGQKQRISIARALVRDPKILLLDEATSALDSGSEKAVQEALDRARHGRTCITIAHRLSSIQNADLIVYMDHGKVQETGSHASLMALKGKYYELVRKQDLAS